MKKITLVLLAGIATLTGCFLVARAISEGRPSTLRAKAFAEQAARDLQAQEREAAEIRRTAAIERIAQRKAAAEDERERAEDERQELATDAKRKQAEADRVTREIREKALASAFTYEITVVANREDGLVVREASAGDTLFFVPHIDATQRLPIGRTLSSKGWRRKLTYRLNDTTVLEVITLAE